MKRIITIVICVLLIVLTVVFLNRITNRLAYYFKGTPNVRLEAKNQYAKEKNYKYVQITDNFKLRRLKGALCASLATALPSFVIILLIAMFFHQFQDNKVVAAMFKGIRPAVVALIAVPTFNLARRAKINLANCWIPIGGALLIWLMGVSPIAIIIIAGIAGYVYGRLQSENS